MVIKEHVFGGFSLWYIPSVAAWHVPILSNFGDSNIDSLHAAYMLF